MRNKYEPHEHYVSRADPTSGRTYNPERNGGALVTYDADGEPISYREVFVEGPPDMREFRPHRWMRGAREVPAMTHTLSGPLAPTVEWTTNANGVDDSITFTAPGEPPRRWERGTDGLWRETTTNRGPS